MSKSNSRLWFLIFSSFVSTSAFADEFYPLMRGARAQAMGNAFTAVADDEEAIFYNPAGLAGIKNFSLNLANTNVEASTDLTGNLAKYSSAFSTPTISSVNTFMGKNLDARGQGVSSFVLPHFGVAFL